MSIKHTREPWAGTLFEDEYRVLCAGIDRERANVTALADALGWALGAHADVPHGTTDPVLIAYQDKLNAARAALRKAGRLP